jgi:predicted lipoprotein with Yx(FWY)xxD motif
MIRGKSSTFLATAAVIPLTALAVASCGGGGGNDATGSVAPPKTANGRTPTVAVQSNGNLGKILVDGSGRTLYLFKKDSGTKSACTGGCAGAWPPLRLGGKPVVGRGVSASMVATAPRSDGKPQVIYNGHPLYTFSGDQKAGDTNGQGLTNFGAGWFVLSPSGNQITKASGSSGGFSY